MNDQEMERFTQELRRIRPAAPPKDLLSRLTVELEESGSLTSKPAQRSSNRIIGGLLKKCVSALALREGLRIRTPRVRRQSTAASLLLQKYPWLPRLVTATACLALAAFVTWRTHEKSTSFGDLTATAAPLKADDVQIDHELVSSFDTIARLPSGEPVRFRCQRWMDQTVISDKERGLVIEQRRPRLEIVPVRFETY